MDRYSKIKTKDKREIVLLIGNGCKWKKCTFCNYYLDANNNEEEQYNINKKVLDQVTGEYGVLEAINSGSIFELNKRSLDELINTCLKKNINKLIIESHYMYKNQIKEFRKKCNDLGIELKVKGGVETFDEHLREDVWKKGFGKVSLDEFKEAFDEINLLVGVKGQNLEQIEKDIEIGKENFERICVNVYKEMEDIIPADKKLEEEFVKKLYPKYKDDPNIDILLQNTDFGVGD